ncbi:MAG TPA: PIN domain-containing protein [Nitrospirota bacterium]|nr:PIN domain-containing protein [Nitrospirota bacterium]
MKIILCDINFILDIFLNREPFYSPAAQIFPMVEAKQLDGYLCANSFPILFYILVKELKRDKAMKILEKVRIVFRVAAVDEKVIDLSLASDFRDFKDAVQYSSAVSTKVDCLITRNKIDYRASDLSIMTPEEFLAAASMG